MIKTEFKLTFPDLQNHFICMLPLCVVTFNWVHATLVQDGRPIRFYIRKLNNTQLNHTVGEKELLDIVESFKAFTRIICGQDLTVHTDYLILLYNKLPSQSMMHWRLLLEECHLKVIHITSVDNNLVDALSRFKLTDNTDDLITMLMILSYGEKRINN